MKIAILSILLIAGFLYDASAQTNCSGIPAGSEHSNISVAMAADTIAAYIDKNWFVILDVRTPSEYNIKHLNQGVNLDYYSSQFAEKLAAYDRNKVYLIHCASGSRSAQVYNQMVNLGFNRVYNMTGGISAWVTAALPTTTAVEPIAAVCNNNIVFENVEIGHTESQIVSLTNAGNDTLRILGVGGPEDGIFTMDPNTDITLNGGFVHEFSVYYTPDDNEADNAVLHVYTNGGTIELNLTGTAFDPNSVSLAREYPFNIINRTYDHLLLVSGNTGYSGIRYAVVTTNGAVVLSGALRENAAISYAGLRAGIYVLLVSGNEGSQSMRFVVED